MSGVRAISEKFVSDLKAGGVLSPVLERVKKDHTLMLAIRDGYVNIYYRGGNILRITEHDGFYETFFDVKYDKSPGHESAPTINNSEAEVRSQKDASDLVASFSIRKNFMDQYFAAYGKSEREFQQLIARENNYSSISKECEYYISDIEVTDPGAARFDMTAIRWLAKDRKKANCKTALIEMKYGDNALEGKAGLLKHLKDIENHISDKRKYQTLQETIQSQFNQLNELELLNYNKGTSNTKINLTTNDKPEVIFILANHNPRSSKLKNILNNPELDKYEHSQLFDLRFYAASFAGYGLHTKCMHTLTEFRELCNI